MFRIASDDQFQNSKPNYSFNSYGSTFTDGMTKHRYSTARFYKGDVITIILNSRNRTIYKQVNDGDVEIVCDGIQTGMHIQYKLAIQLGKVHNSVTLLDFDLSC